MYQRNMAVNTALCTIRVSTRADFGARQNGPNELDDFSRPFRAWASGGRLTQGAARGLALPWASPFRAFSPAAEAEILALLGGATSRRPSPCLRR